MLVSIGYVVVDDVGLVGVVVLEFKDARFDFVDDVCPGAAPSLPWPLLTRARSDDVVEEVKGIGLASGSETSKVIALTSVFAKTSVIAKTSDEGQAEPSS